MTGIEDAILVYLFVRETEREPTLLDIHQGLTKPEAFCLELERYVKSKENISEELLQQIETRKTDEFGLLRLGEFLGNESDSQKAKEQYTWQTNAIVRAISVITNSPSLREAFCLPNSPSLQQVVERENRTLILNQSADEYPDSSYTIARMLRLLFMRYVSMSSKKRGHSETQSSAYTFLLVDEYQQFVHAGTRQQHDSLRDDNTWFDRSRSYRHINIVATQSVSSLLAQIDSSAVDTIIQNCQTTIVLPSTDKQTLDRVRLLSAETQDNSPIMRSLVNPKGQGEGFIHIANCRATRGASVAGLMLTGKLTNPAYTFMNQHIGKPRKQTESNHSAVGTQVSNPFVREKPLTCNGRVHVVANVANSEHRNWLERLTCHPGIKYVGLIDILARQNVPWTYRNGLDDYAQHVEIGDLVLIPVLNDKDQLRVIKSLSLKRLAEELKEAQTSLLMNPDVGTPLNLERLLDGVFDSPDEMIEFVHQRLPSGTALLKPQS